MAQWFFPTVSLYDDMYASRVDAISRRDFPLKGLLPPLLKTRFPNPPGVIPRSLALIFAWSAIASEKSLLFPCVGVSCLCCFLIDFEMEFANTPRHLGSPICILRLPSTRDFITSL